MRIGLIAFLTVSLGAAALAGEPTLKEMLKEAKQMSVKPEEPVRPGTPGPALPSSEYIGRMKARLEVEMGKMVRGYDQRNDYRELGRAYFDLHNYQKALQYYLEYSKQQRDWRVQVGYAHGTLARVYMMLAQPELAREAEKEFGRRVTDVHRMRHHEELITWMKEFDGHKAEVEKLKAKADADPKDAESRWRLLDLYRHDYPRKLDEFLGLMEFRELYPKHGNVTGGECNWRLMEVMWRFGIRDEALKMAEDFRKSFPEHGGTTGGEATYRLGEYYRELGRWAQALECYKEMSKFPKHWTNGRHEDRPTRIEDRISEMLGKLRGDR